MVAKWRTELGKELDIKFWSSVLSNTFSSLIAAWIVFFVGVSVALAARGVKGSSVNWAPALAAAGLCIILGLALMYGCRSALVLLLCIRPSIPSASMLVGASLIGATACIGWFAVPGVTGVVGFWVTVVATVAAGIPWGNAFFPRPRRKMTRRGWLYFHWCMTALSIIVVALSGVSIGAILARATT